jgi:hypothetical protein
MSGPSARFATIGLGGALLATGLAPASRLVVTLRDDGANRADTERFERGYYERLLDSGRRPDVSTPAAPAPFDAGRLCDVVGDLREYVLRPSLHTTHRGASWTTNSLGMRDGEYPVAKPPGVLRIALVGDSIGSGWGVDDGKGFEPLVEGALSSVEILNFSVPGHAPGQRWEHFRRIGLATSADLVIFEATPADPGWDERRLRGLLARNIGWDAPQYRDALATSRASKGGDAESYKSALKPHRWAILENVYRSAARECRDRGLVPAWVLIPRVGKPIDPTDRAKMVGIAQDAGFAIVIDLSSAFDGIAPGDLAIAPDDFHPNERGHRILADQLLSALTSHPSWRSIAGVSR